ncbi:hypothetical protein F383_01396 [Gossypium arboreum]|uniref:Uncharacterized protein n=1 Tax=Gossypium arboreum TaxID=29729 RepID=A0A0B0PGU5_GOSAR|nr:hypothetical protein F383_01396 [Gossypium arboreum]
MFYRGSIARSIRIKLEVHITLSSC